MRCLSFRLSNRALEGLRLITIRHGHISPVSCFLIPPTATKRWSMSRVADQKTDTESDGGGGVGIVFHEPLESIVACDGDGLDCFGTLDSGIDRLAVGLLRGTRGLLHEAFSFGLGVADDLAEALFNPSADVADRA